MQPLLPILEPAERLLRDLLVAIQTATHLPWAWTIVILTCIVRLAIMPLSASQIRASVAQQRLQPYVTKLRERYKDDRQLLNQKMMEFYRDNSINPFASCLPTLAQLPVFIALLYALDGFSPDTGSRSFMLGLVDDIFVDVDNAGVGGWTLLATYVLVQVLSTWVMSATMPAQNRWLFYVMPVGFAWLLKGYSCGVMIYWTASGVWTIGQYKLLMARYKRRPQAELVLPEDSRGVKKVVGGNKQQAGEAAAASKAGSSSQAGGSTAPARKNKRRR